MPSLDLPLDLRRGTGCCLHAAVINQPIFTTCSRAASVVFFYRMHDACVELNAASDLL